MKSRKDAERAVKLCEQREALHTRAGSIRMADEISVCDANRDKVFGRPQNVLMFAHLTEELRELIRREVEKQIAAIDKELNSLGVVPDEFDAAAPGQKVTTPSK